MDSVQVSYLSLKVQVCQLVTSLRSAFQIWKPLKVSEQEETTLKLKLKKKDKSTKRIQWTEDTIDNEGLGKKKSKCCCQYTKPRTNLDDSSSESEEDCEHCPGQSCIEDL